MRKFFALLSALSLLIVTLSGCNSISEANPATDFEYGYVYESDAETGAGSRKRGRF